MLARLDRCSRSLLLQPCVSLADILCTACLPPPCRPTTTGGGPQVGPRRQRLGECPIFFSTLRKAIQIIIYMEGEGGIASVCESSNKPILMLTSQTVCSHLMLWWFFADETELHSMHAYVCFLHPESSVCGRLCSPLSELGNFCVVAELPESD